MSNESMATMTSEQPNSLPGARTLNRSFLLVSACSVAAFSCGSAQAQNSTDNGGQLKEIVVTAQKREQSLQQVGITMQAISGDQLASARIVDASQLANVVPGLNVAGANAGQTLLFGIRGVVQQDFVGSAESSVGVYIDDGYIAFNNISGVGLVDIDHVEVLKGPQGTLFGRNATGGIVNIFTRKPTDTWEGYAKISGGSYNSARLEAALGGPLSEQFKMRISGVYDRNNAWVDNLAPTGGDLGGKRAYALRAHLEYDPGTNFNALLSLHTARVRQSWGPYFSASTRQVFDANGFITDSVIVDEPTLLGTEPSDPKHLVLNADQAKSHDGSNFMTGGTLKLSWDVGPELVAITDYKKSASHAFVDNDASPQAWLDSNNNGYATNYSQEVRLFQDKGSFRWYGGLFYLHIHSGENPNKTTLWFAPAIVKDFSSLKTNSYSAFGQIEYDFGDGFTIVGGIRATRENKRYSYFSNAYTIDDVLLGPARTSFEGRMNKWLYSGKAQLEYHASPDLMLYAGYNRGTKAGSYNTPFAGGTAYPDSAIPYKPETLHAFEVGEKATLFNGMARLNGSVFYYDYRNYQAFKLIGLSTQITNHLSHIYGSEIEFEAKPTRHLTLMLSGSYTNDKIYKVDIGGATTLTRRAPYTSKWKASALARYEIPSSIGDFAIQAGADYVGSYWYSITNYSSTRVPSYVIGKASLTWTDLQKQWSLALDVQNLGDKRYKNVGFDISGLCGCSQVGYNKPRWFTVTLGRNF